MLKQKEYKEENFEEAIIKSSFKRTINVSKVQEISERMAKMEMNKAKGYCKHENKVDV